MIYGYTRVSTDRQAERGLGLEAQQVRIREFARARWGARVKISIEIESGVSASKVPFARRPRGSALDAAMRSGDHLVIAKLDRGFRNLRDCAGMLHRWHSRGVVVHLIDIGASTDSPVGHLLIGIMAAIAEWESRRIGERIREAHAALRRRGLYPTGNPPLGYRLRRRKLVPDRRVQATIGLIWRLLHSRSHPPVTCRMVAEYLTASRRPGAPWTAKRCWAAARAPEAQQWARGQRLPPDWAPPIGYRHARGERKRQAAEKISPATRRYRAHLGQEARRGR